MKKYDEIKYAGRDWYIISLNKDGSADLLLKNRIPVEEVREMFPSDLLDDDYDVKFNNDGSDWRWADSPIRNVLNSKFLEKFNKDEFNKMTTTVELDGEKSTTKDYVRLLTKEEVESLPENLRRVNSLYGYWTLSPSSFNAWAPCASVWTVDPTGYLVYHWVGDSYGLRPVINVKSNILNNLKEQKKIPEKIEIYEDEEGHYFIDKHCHKIYITCDEINYMVEEFNNIIDYLKSKGE